MFPNEEESYEDVGALLRRTYAASKPTDQFLNRLHEQLLSELADSEQPQERRLSARPWNRITHWMGGLTMRQRIALGGGASAVILGLLLLWGHLVAKPVSAMEEMAKSIRQATSYKYSMSVRFDDDTRGYRRDLTGTVYWLAPGSVRSETTYDEDKWAGPGPEIVSVYPLRQPGIHIFHPHKTFYYLPVRQKALLMAGTDDIASLGKFSGKADRQLGTKQINGKNAQGYIIDIERISAGHYSGFAEVWLNIDGSLPLFIRYDLKSPDFSCIHEITDIEWNIDLEPKLFDITPPEGYSNSKPAPSREERVGQITEALKIYAAASGGYYPPKSIDAGTVDEACKMLGVAEWPRKNETDGNAGKAAKVVAGVDQVLRLQIDKAEFAYYGKSVGPKDKDKVLLSWKLNDGWHEVIFGDLHSDTMTTKRLRALEAK